MFKGKRGEVDNKFLLIVVLVVAVIFLSNNRYFSGKAVRTNLAYIQPQASGGAHAGNVYTSRDPSLDIVSSPKGRSGTQYATGGGGGACEQNWKCAVGINPNSNWREQTPGPDWEWALYHPTGGPGPIASPGRDRKFQVVFFAECNSDCSCSPITNPSVTSGPVINQCRDYETRIEPVY